MRRVSAVVTLLATLAGAEIAIPIARSQSEDELRAVIVVARHGVRAPIDGELHGGAYNARPWPKWSTPSAFLTQHGADALKALGDFYRQRYQAFLSGSDGCRQIYARANQVQRTIASAHAILAGLAPQCHVAVVTLGSDDAPLLMRDPEKKAPDPVFEVEAFTDRIDRNLWAAAVRGQIGDDPARWLAERRSVVAEIDRLMASCPGCADGATKARRSLLNDPSSVSAGTGSSLVSIATPVSAAGDFAQVFYLEYLEGLPMRDVAWGQLSPEKVQELMGLSVEFRDRTLRTPYSAEAGASELATRIDATLRQAATGQTVDGAFGSQSQPFTLLMGHDGNLTRLGGLLRLQWLLPEGVVNSTPPGSALVFELRRSGGRHVVRVGFQSQTAEQIRSASALTSGNPPAAAPVFIPGCSTSAAGFPCDLDEFHKVVQRAANPSFVLSGPRR